jgi:MFS family permease
MFGMWSCLYAYTPELYPTGARSTGAGMASACGRVGAISGPIIVGYIIGSVGDAGVFTLGATSFALAALVVLVLGIEDARTDAGRNLREEEETVTMPLAPRAQPCSPQEYASLALR